MLCREVYQQTVGAAKVRIMSRVSKYLGVQPGMTTTLTLNEGPNSKCIL